MRKLARAVILFGGALLADSAAAQMVVEQSAEHRFQLDFRVNDAALQKMLPPGWEPAIATQGPAKDANLRMIFIDRMTVLGADGRPKGSERLVYLAIPVRQTGGAASGQMIIAGLTDDAAAAPGPFGTMTKAGIARMNRSVSSADGVAVATEDWEFAGGGERMSVHVVYERAPANRGGGEVRFFHPSNPGRYQIFKTEQGLDILRNVTTTPRDRVKEFSYAAVGGRLSALFDGSEKVLSWDSLPYYNRTIQLP